MQLVFYSSFQLTKQKNTDADERISLRGFSFEFAQWKYR